MMAMLIEELRREQQHMKLTERKCVLGPFFGDRKAAARRRTGPLVTLLFSDVAEMPNFRVFDGALF